MDDTNIRPSTIDVRSFYLELLVNEVYYDETYSVYVDHQIGCGKEDKRRELRI
ncbi:hypothetical protein METBISCDRAFT_26953 [Metschnikowia bicuspidata]|uniref:Uncharacterized protein n=1 Tax=Metschnikowia bicuspidata TaxID=27322 RepID=A0A4P9ZG76_9ASCO|nr:hypothetical protein METBISCDRAFT_26953 [Metschnikowia bicuspidata]